MECKWISVKDRLPDANRWKCYAVLCNEKKYHRRQIAWFDEQDEKFMLEKGNIILKVTHWMPLPDLPDERE